LIDQSRVPRGLPPRFFLRVERARVPRESEIETGGDDREQEIGDWDLSPINFPFLRYRDCNDVVVAVGCISGNEKRARARARDTLAGGSLSLSQRRDVYGSPARGIRSQRI